MKLKNSTRSTHAAAIETGRKYCRERQRGSSQNELNSYILFLDIFLTYNHKLIRGNVKIMKLLVQVESNINREKRNGNN
jgi:hypothetical protein